MRTKKFKTCKNLLVLSKKLLATIQEPETHWDFLWVKKYSIRVNFGSFWVKLSWFGNRNRFMRKWKHIKLSHRESLFPQLELFLYWNILITNAACTFLKASDKFDSASNMLRKLPEWVSRMNICTAIKNASCICCIFCVL